MSYSSNRFTDSTIVYLSVGFLLLQITTNGAVPAVDTTESATTSSSSETTANKLIDNISDQTGTAINSVQSAVSNTSSMLNNMMGQYTEGISSVIQNATSTAVDFGSEATKSVEEMIKAGGRVTLAIGSLCNSLFNGFSTTAATGTSIMAKGANNVDSVLSYVPVLGTVTSGLNNMMSGMSSTVNELTDTGRNSREQLIKKLRSDLNQSYQDTTTADNTAAGKTTTDTAGTGTAATSETSTSETTTNNPATGKSSKNSAIV